MGAVEEEEEHPVAMLALEVVTQKQQIQRKKVNQNLVPKRAEICLEEEETVTVTMTARIKSEFYCRSVSSSLEGKLKRHFLCNLHVEISFCKMIYFYHVH